MKCVEKFAKRLVAKGIVSENNSDWLQYGIERRLTTILIGCPFFALALLLTNLNTSVAFFLSFYFLRRRTNGFHSKSVFGCLTISLLCEFFFLTVFYYSITPHISIYINAINIVLVFLLAPYKDPSFPLTKKELQTITNSARVRVLVLVILAYILPLLGMYDCAKGITTGNAMAAFLLSLAYILNGGKSYEQPAGKSKKNCAKSGISDD